MATEILPFAIDPGANVLPQIDYDALPARDDGFSAGLARSDELNKVWRQSSFMAAAFANFMDGQGVSQPDDGDLFAAVVNIENALKAFILANTSTPNVFTGGTTGGSANAQTIGVLSPSGFTKTDGVSIICTAGFTNFGATTFNAVGTGVGAVKKDSGGSLVALTGGEFTTGLTVYLTWSQTNNCYVISGGLQLGALAYLGIGAGLANDGGGNLKAIPLPGSQVQQVIATNATYQSLTTPIPYDNSIPQSNEGDQILTVNITPTNASNFLLIECVAFVGNISGGRPVITLFQDAGTDALDAAPFSPTAGNGMTSTTMLYRKTAGSIAATTFKIRAGDVSGAPTLNGGNGGARYGGTCVTKIIVTEIQA